MTRPRLGLQLLYAAGVGVLFAASWMLLFGLTGKLLPRFQLTRVFIVTAFASSVVVYEYGDFKTLLGDGTLFYEVPWGVARLGISAGCGAVIAVLTTVAAATFP